MNNVYMTVLSAPYVPRALALFTSLMKYANIDLFAFFCMDERSATILESIKLPGSRIYRECDFADDTFLALRGKRSDREYCWTAKPFALCHALDTIHNIDWAVFLDADTLAFGDPNVAIEAAGPSDFLFTPHRFSREFINVAPITGSYNSGYFACRASSNGKAVATRWRDLCVDSCPEQPTADTYSDQKYLERLMKEIPGGRASQHIGLNAGPWNIAQYGVTSEKSRVLLDGTPLLLFHYQALRLLTKNWIDLYPGEIKLTPNVRKLIYVPYLETLSRAYAMLSEVTAMDELKSAAISHGVKGWLRHVRRIVIGNTNLYRFPLFT